MKKPRTITLESVCSLKEVAEFIGMGQSTIYEKTTGPNAYKLEFPLIKKTTPKHFLAWAANADAAKPEAPGVVEQREHEKRRLRSVAGIPHEPTSSRGSRNALPRRGKSLAGHSARS